MILQRGTIGRLTAMDVKSTTLQTDRSDGFTIRALCIGAGDALQRIEGKLWYQNLTRKLFIHDYHLQLHSCARASRRDGAQLCKSRNPQRSSAVSHAR